MPRTIPAMLQLGPPARLLLRWPVPVLLGKTQKSENRSQAAGLPAWLPVCGTDRHVSPGPAFADSATSFQRAAFEAGAIGSLRART